MKRRTILSRHFYLNNYKFTSLVAELKRVKQVALHLAQTVHQMLICSGSRDFSEGDRHIVDDLIRGLVSGVGVEKPGVVRARNSSTNNISLKIVDSSYLRVKDLNCCA